MPKLRVHTKPHSETRLSSSTTFKEKCPISLLTLTLRLPETSKRHLFSWGWKQFDQFVITFLNFWLPLNNTCRFPSHLTGYCITEPNSWVIQTANQRPIISVAREHRKLSKAASGLIPPSLQRNFRQHPTLSYLDFQNLGKHTWKPALGHFGSSRVMLEWPRCKKMEGCKRF